MQINILKRFNLDKLEKRNKFLKIDFAMNPTFIKIWKLIN